jgi:hypothetical protein
MIAKIWAFAIGISFIFGLYYNNPNEEFKLKCTRCDNTYFSISEKTTIFVGEGNTRVKKTGKFYKCTKCTMLTDQIAGK